MSTNTTEQATFTDRVERGLRIASTQRIIPHQDGSFQVQSESNPELFYQVQTSGSCSCPDSSDNNNICKHAWATVGLEAAELIKKCRDKNVAFKEYMNFDLEEMPTGIAKQVVLEARKVFGNGLVDSR